MSGLERRPSRLPRREREQRAYRLVLAMSAFGLIAVVGFILAIAGVIGGGIPFFAAVIAVICFIWFRRTVRG
jgi:hypothetical protein